MENKTSSGGNAGGSGKKTDSTRKNRSGEGKQKSSSAGQQQTDRTGSRKNPERPRPSLQTKKKSSGSEPKASPAKAGEKKPDQQHPGKKLNKTKLPAAHDSGSSRLKLKKAPAPKKMGQEEVDRSAENVLSHGGKQAEKKKQNLKPLAPPKELASPYVRRLKKVLLTVGIITAVVLIFLVLSLTVFFKIDVINVEGKTRYDHNEIVAASMIELGDNLILCKTSPGEKNIERQFPYIETVSIHKKLFNEIVVEVKEAVPASIVESSGSYIVLSKSAKILEVNDKKKYDIPTVLGAKLKDVKLGAVIEYSDENLKKHLDQIITALADLGIKDVTTIDITNTSRVTLIRKDGFRIILGNLENPEYKLKTAVTILGGDIKEGRKGTLDVSLASSDGGKSYLKYDAEAEVSKAESKPVQESSQESSEPEQESQPAEEPEPEYEPEYEPEDEPEYEPEYEPEDEPEYEPEYEPESEPEGEPEDEPEGEPEGEPEDEPEDEPEGEPEEGNGE